MEPEHNKRCRRKYPTCICLTCKNDSFMCCLTDAHEKVVRCPESPSETNQCPDYVGRKRKPG